MVLGLKKLFNLKYIPHYGDIIAIPFFLLGFLYFLSIEERSMVENCLLVFTFFGFVNDIIFTILFFHSIS